MASPPRYNPFKPGSIVDPAMFAGRAEELATLERILFQTRNGNPEHFIIDGERGIGKSSLLFYLRQLAAGEIPCSQETRHDFLTLFISLERSNSYTDIVMRIARELARVLAAKNPADELVKKIWDFIKRLEVMHVSLKGGANVTPPEELLYELSDSLRATLERMAGLNGVLILLDEADSPPASSELGRLIKMLTERFVATGCKNVAIGLAGLTGVVARLSESHESAPRLFRIIRLEPLTPEERHNVIELGLKEALEKNQVETKINPLAAKWISDMSEGYPHFVQQFAYSAFDSDSDNMITVEDVALGSLGQNGALRQLGVKYFSDLFFEKTLSNDYRTVLRAMAAHSADWVSRADLRNEAKVSATALNNALTALKARHVIVPKPGSPGMYRLPFRSFATWIRLFTSAEESRAAPSTPGAGG